MFKREFKKSQNNLNPIVITQCVFINKDHFDFYLLSHKTHDELIDLNVKTQWIIAMMVPKSSPM